MEITVGQRFKHYKGSVYVVIALGRDSNTTEKVVVYQNEGEDPEFGSNPIWVRFEAEFLEKVEVNNVVCPRFMLL